MFRNVHVTREDGRRLLRSHVETLSDQQLEDALSAIFYDQHINFRTVPEYKTVSEEQEQYFLKLNGIEHVR